MMRFLIDAASVPPEYGLSPTVARNALMMLTALAPPCTSAMMSCASSYRASGIGIALPTVLFAAAAPLEYFFGTEITDRESAGRVVVTITAERGSDSPASVFRSRDTG